MSPNTLCVPIEQHHRPHDLLRRARRDMKLLLLASTLNPPTNLNLPTFDLNTIVVRLIALIPLIGGYLLAREGRGNLLWEILAVCLLVLATVVPVQLTYNGLPSLLDTFLSRAPVALL